MPADRRSGVVTSASEEANSNRPVRKITCGANGTQDGVIASSFCGAARWAVPAATYSAASIQRIAARPVPDDEACAAETVTPQSSRLVDDIGVRTVAARRGLLAPLALLVLVLDDFGAARHP